MRLLDDSIAFVIVGERTHIVRGPLALSDACDKAARLRLKGGRWIIMEPRFCVHGCCILEDAAQYGVRQAWDRRCTKIKPGRQLV